MSPKNKKTPIKPKFIDFDLVGLSPENNPQPGKRKQRQRQRIRPAIKRAIVNAAKAGERPQAIAARLNLLVGSVYNIINTQNRLSLVAIRNGVGIKSFAPAQADAAPAQSTPALSADAANKLRDIALFCEVDKAEALSACVIFYYKHLREVVQQRIKA